MGAMGMNAYKQSGRVAFLWLNTEHGRRSMVVQKRAPNIDPEILQSVSCDPRTGALNFREAPISASCSGRMLGGTVETTIATCKKSCTDRRSPSTKNCRNVVSLGGASCVHQYEPLGRLARGIG